MGKNIWACKIPPSATAMIRETIQGKKGAYVRVPERGWINERVRGHFWVECLTWDFHSKLVACSCKLQGTKWNTFASKRRVNVLLFFIAIQPIFLSSEKILKICQKMLDEFLKYQTNLLKKACKKIQKDNPNFNYKKTFQKAHSSVGKMWTWVEKTTKPSIFKSLKWVRGGLSEASYLGLRGCTYLDPFGGVL